MLLLAANWLKADGKRSYGVPLRTETMNCVGLDVATEEQSRTNGWETPALRGSPVALKTEPAS